MHTMFALLSSLFVSPSAHAFCGTYVSGAGTELYNNLSQVALVRQNGMTTVSVYNDVEGDTSDFAMVIPVPVVLPPAAVNVLEHDIFTRLDNYSQPRVVSYECADFEEDTTWWSSVTEF